MSRTYSPAEKADALAHLTAEGGNVKRAAREAGVPRKTLEGWSKGRGVTAEVLRMSEHSKKVLAGKLFREADEAADTLAEKRGGAGYRDVMVGIGIAVDKAQLLTGQPTQIAESVEQAARLRLHSKRLIDLRVEAMARRAVRQGQQLPRDARAQAVAELCREFPDRAEYFMAAEAPCEMCGAVGFAREELAPRRERPPFNPDDPLSVQIGEPVTESVARLMVDKYEKLARGQGLVKTREEVAEALCNHWPELRPFLSPEGGSLAA